MWAAGKSEPDNDLGDNNRGEENRVGEKWGSDGGRMSREVVGGERVCFVFNVIVFAFPISNCFPVPVMLRLTMLLL